MNIGLYDVDSHNYPNLPLMKISAWHKARGDNVEFVVPIKHYDKIYVSKVFGAEYSQISNTCLRADEIVYGGTGFAITIENGKEIYHKDRDKSLAAGLRSILLNVRLCISAICRIRYRRTTARSLLRLQTPKRAPCTLWINFWRNCESTIIS